MMSARRTGGTSLSLMALAVVAGLLLLGSSVASAQMGHQPVPSVPGMPAAPAAEVVIDTATAVFDLSEMAVAPTRFHTVQDTVVFGDLFHLVLDFPEALEAQPEIPLVAGEDWLVAELLPEPGLLDRLLGRGISAVPDFGDLPDSPDDTRFVVSFRIYRTNPFLVQADTFQSPVIQVVGRVDGTSDTSPIRAPRQQPWSPWIILGLLGLLALALVVARLLWKRGGGKDDWADRAIPAPAWLIAAIDLRDLLAKGFLNRGESRPFLDGLAGISRRFVAGRYRIAAQEMTGREITSSCGGLGYLSPSPGVFARLIDAVDHHRYNPEAAPPAWCRDQAILFFREIGRVRVMPHYTDVPEGLVVESEIAWQDLGRELAAGSDRVVPTGSGTGGEQT